MTTFTRLELMPHARREAIAKATRDGIELQFHIVDDAHAAPDHLGTFSFECARPATFSFEHIESVASAGWFNAENVETREQARENYDRARAFGESWCYYGLEVRAYKCGVKLATASLWGVDSDSDESYFLETANDLAEEALVQAKQMLEALAK